MTRRPDNPAASRRSARAIDRVLDRCTSALAIVAGLLIASGGLLICASVASRASGRGGIGAAEEYVGALTMVAVFAGMSHTYREGGHVRATMLVERFSGPVRKVLEIIAAVVSFGFAVVLCTAVVTDWWQLYQGGARSPSRTFEQWIPMTGVVVGSLLLVLETLFWGARIVTKRPGRHHVAGPGERAIKVDLDGDTESYSHRNQMDSEHIRTSVGTSKETKS